MKSKTIFTISSLLLIGSIFFLFDSNKVNADNNCFLLNNNNICMTEDNYNNLISLGFDYFEINNLTQGIFDENKDLHGTVVSDTTNYYRDTYFYSLGNITSTSTSITEEEYNNYVPSLISSNYNLRSYDGYVETSYKKMRTKIIQVGNHYRYKNTLDWKQLPSVRSYDIIGIGLESSVVSHNNVQFQQTYCATTPNCTSSTTSIINNPITGAGAAFKLPTGTYVKLQSFIYYDVYKRNSNQTNVTLNAYGDYSHAIESVTQSEASYSYTVNQSGNDLDYTIITKYDEIPEAEAQYNVVW